MENEFIEIGEWTVLNETKKAILARIGDVQFWIPKSQIKDVQRFHRGYRGPLWIASWWIEVNELDHLARAAPAAASPVNLISNANRIYRRLAAKYHPDRSPETAEFMKDLNELWQAILDDLKRGGSQ